jgi:hypothetical protein
MRGKGSSAPAGRDGSTPANPRPSARSGPGTGPCREREGLLGRRVGLNRIPRTVGTVTTATLFPGTEVPMLRYRGRHGPERSGSKDYGLGRACLEAIRTKLSQR